MIMLRSNDDKKDLSGIYNMYQFIQSIKKNEIVFYFMFVAEFNFYPYFSVPIQAPLGDATAQGGTQVEPAPQCCACGEARYKMHFQGLWSRQTHPKGFPIDDGKFQLHSSGRPSPRETLLHALTI